jgi:hypothetical protein
MADNIALIQECHKNIAEIKKDYRELIQKNGDDLVRRIKNHLADIGIEHGTEVTPIRCDALRDYYKDGERLSFADVEPCEDSPKFVFFTYKKDGTVSRRETKINFSSLKAPYLKKVS